MANLTGLPAGSWVVVTGANGYIGSHVVNTLLQLGYRVRGTIRTPKPWLDVLFETKYGQGVFESFILPNFDDQEMLDKCLDGTSGIVHVASDVSFNNDPNSVVPWVVRAVENVLKAASRHSSIKRFVLTSSSSAVLVPAVNKKGVRVDESTWNEDAVKAAFDPNVKTADKAYLVYAASKTLGEQAAWKWIEEHNPQFIFNAVLPNFNTGEILHKEIGGSTMGMIRGLLKGDKGLFDFLTPQYYVDVVDTARLHAIALLAPNIRSQRIFAFAGPFNITDTISTLQRLRPDRKFVDPPSDEGQDLTDVAPAGKAEKLLQEFFGQKGWTPLEESIADGIRDL
ncbi:NAD dependent epimerase/dehydratase [Penicillium atrosanguineum]|uniref:NAD dependent epimerase/dehydratase n=1 Tax=Penicillium atrosanguineum TaxID=1132637 RepID=A0A9W9LB48_9EURO|nr:Major facilitator superfamily domain general substrate transporter [Penicillium atrosanguineum]KAJ5129101.1 NAD dependent epimerase/dehydratase [Penicillium atrosanguineum]KAJ5145418.1 NAD dependent epimerase/dehydratase [Penicillium atrosanguineum]KAJ5301212.1 Major facilitator superfamily domain general substrate transporter [Penicillium atrosanguineum]KAJ5311855.1 NAD dependent epimerase/dehydratase [Penicillium atrosanguineum]